MTEFRTCQTCGHSDHIENMWPECPCCAQHKERIEREEYKSDNMDTNIPLDQMHESTFDVPEYPFGEAKHDISPS